VNSGFHCEEDENCALVGYYAASSGRLSQNIGKKLPLLAAY